MRPKDCADRAAVTTYIADAYGAAPEYPWLRYPNYAVFRHTSNRKWFALLMDVPRNRLGLEGDARTDILNVKLDDPLLMDLLLSQPGYLPGYHISRGSWVSVLLDGTVSCADVFRLIDRSYAVTAVKVKRKR